MAPEESPQTVRRRLGWLILHFTLIAAFAKLSVFGSIFVLLLRQLGIDEGRIGALLAIVPLCGLVAPLVTPAVARWGFRRTYLVFFTLRQVFMAGMLLLPLIVPRGVGAIFVWVALCILLFGLGRAIAEVGVYPWLQEIVPNPVRGKFNAVMSALSTGAGVVTAAAGGIVIRDAAGPEPYLKLLAVGIALALLANFFAAAVPVGGAARDDYDHGAHRTEMGQALRDRNFVTYLTATLAAILANTALFGFAPLFLKEQVGFSAGQVVGLDMSGALGGMLASFPAGWVADRHGSKPVMCAGIALTLLAPALLLGLRLAGPSIPLAVLVGALAGGANAVWLVAMDRYFFVGAVPPGRSAGYTAVFYAVLGAAGGIGPVIAGLLVRAGNGLLPAGPGYLNSPYMPLFLWCTLLLALTLDRLRRLATDKTL